MAKNVAETVRIYRLVDPALLSRHADDLARVLFQVAFAEDAGGMLGVSPASGFLFFSDTAIWKEDAAGGRLLSDKSAAESAARSFLLHANQLVARDSQLRRERCPPLFPSEVRHVLTKLMVHPDSGRPDHWLSQFAVDLTLNIAGQLAPVLGATIEVRTGAAGKVVGLSSRWRPIVSSDSTRLLNVPGQPSEPVRPAADVMRARLTESIEPIAAPVPPVAGNGAAEEEPKPALAYVMQDETALQTVIAPYYAVISGHDGFFYPATTYSLLLNIVQSNGAGGVLLQALVAGGSGSYAYEWASWSPNVFQEGSRNLGTGLEAEVPSGVHNVVLRVTDKATNVTAQTEAMVFAA